MWSRPAHEFNELGFSSNDGYRPPVLGRFPRPATFQLGLGPSPLSGTLPVGQPAETARSGVSPGVTLSCFSTGVPFLSSWPLHFHSHVHLQGEMRYVGSCVSFEMEDVRGSRHMPRAALGLLGGFQLVKRALACYLSSFEHPSNATVHLLGRTLLEADSRPKTRRAASSVLYSILRANLQIAQTDRTV